MKGIRSVKEASSTVGTVLAIVACGAGSLGAAQPTVAQASLQARVQRLEDRAAIRNLLVEYGHDLNTGNLVACSNLFANDGTWSGLLGSARGVAGILKLMQKVMANAKPYDPKHVQNFHLMTNFHIRVDGDRATATSKWTFFARSEHNKLVPRLSGHYNDVFIREDGKWKFLSRVAPRDIP